MLNSEICKAQLEKCEGLMKKSRLIPSPTILKSVKLKSTEKTEFE
jgi:hypothetical protein